MPFAALRLGGPEQGGAKDRRQVVEGHLVDRLLLCNPMKRGDQRQKNFTGKMEMVSSIALHMKSTLDIGTVLGIQI